MLGIPGRWWSTLAGGSGGRHRPEMQDPAGRNDAQGWWLLPGDLSHAAALDLSRAAAVPPAGPPDG